MRTMYQACTSFWTQEVSSIIQHFPPFSLLKIRTFGSRKQGTTKEHKTVSFSAWQSSGLTLTVVRQTEKSGQQRHVGDIPIPTTNSGGLSSPG